MTGALRRGVENTARLLRGLAAYLSVWPRWLVALGFGLLLGLLFLPQLFSGLPQWFWDWWNSGSEP
jgi:hypothetical protein